MTESNLNYIIPVAALDIGYFSTKGATKVDRILKTFDFPSQCARVTSTQIVSVGMNALSGINVNVNNTSYFVGPDSALHAKGRESRSISDNFVSTEEYKALFLGGLHYILREHIKEVRGKKKVSITRFVAGLPLNTFNQLQMPVREMFEGTHIVPMPDNTGNVEVHIKSVLVIPQPQGAMINSGLQQKAENISEYYSQNLLIVDMGGGTCDWLLSNNKKAVVSRCGAYQKGVIACVYAICDSINKNLRDDPLVVQRIDDAIRNGKESFKLSGTIYNVEEQMAHVTPILNECLNSVLTSVSSLTSVDHIIFTGGGGKMLYEAARTVWSEFTTVMTVDANPVYSNVCGFYYLGASLNA